MKRRMWLWLWCLIFILPQGVHGNSVEAIPSTVSVTMNGQLWEMDLYRHDDEHYIKLRDYEALVSGTADALDIEWHQDTETIVLKTSPFYESGAYEYQRLSPARAEIVTRQFSNGMEAKALFIADQHYFRLRDLTDITGTVISWNGREKLIGMIPKNGRVCVALDDPPIYKDGILLGKTGFLFIDEAVLSDKLTRHPLAPLDHIYAETDNLDAVAQWLDYQDELSMALADSTSYYWVRPGEEEWILGKAPVALEQVVGTTNPYGRLYLVTLEDGTVKTMEQIYTP